MATFASQNVFGVLDSDDSRDRPCRHFEPTEDASDEMRARCLILNYANEHLHNNDMARSIPNNAGPNTSSANPKKTKGERYFEIYHQAEYEGHSLNIGIQIFLVRGDEVGEYLVKIWFADKGVTDGSAIDFGDITEDEKQIYYQSEGITIPDNAKGYWVPRWDCVRRYVFERAAVDYFPNGIETKRSLRRKARIKTQKLDRRGGLVSDSANENNEHVECSTKAASMKDKANTSSDVFLQTGEDSNPNAYTTFEKLVPRNRVGWIIGTRGTIIKEIQRSTGAVIDGPRHGAEAGQMDPAPFTVKGNRRQVEKAVDLMQQILDKKLRIRPEEVEMIEKD